MSDSAELGRRKGLVSCERCKQRKLKCGRETPTCARCKRAPAVCLYAGRKKPGFAAGHRQLLEDKIDMLEAELRKHRSRDDPPSPSHDEAVGRSFADSFPPESFSSNVYAPSLRRQHTPMPTFERTQQLPKRTPPMDLVLSLTSLFFRHVHPWFPFLNTQRVFKDMATMNKPSNSYNALFGICLPFSCDSRLDQISSDSFWTYIKRQIFIDILEEPSYNSLEALTILTLDLSGMTNGPQVWGALAVAIKLTVQLRPVDGHNLRISAGSGVESAVDSNGQKYRQRLFWAIYALDSYITITTRHPSELTNYHLQHFLPTRELVWREPDFALVTEQPQRGHGNTTDVLTITPAFIFNHQLELLDISRRLHKIHISYASAGADETALAWIEEFLACSADLSTWAVQIPQPLHLNTREGSHTAGGPYAPALLMLHGYYHALVIHLHSMAAYPSDDAVQARLAHLTSDSQQRCMSSVVTTTTISGVVSDHGMVDKVGWPFAWAIWIAAKYLLIQGRQGGRDSLHEQLWPTLLRCLESLSSYCQIASKYLRLLNQGGTELKALLFPEDEAAAVLLTKTTPRMRGVLNDMMNMCIPTCDLEDRFRTDPILHGDNPSRQVQTNSVPHDMSWESGGGGRGTSGSRTNSINYLLEEDDDVFNRSSMASDEWFSLPLFASSGYEQ